MSFFKWLNNKLREAEYENVGRTAASIPPADYSFFVEKISNGFVFRCDSFNSPSKRVYCQDLSGVNDQAIAYIAACELDGGSNAAASGFVNQYAVTKGIRK